MRAVASRLEVEAMSLYHHVANKQALLDGMVDLVVKNADLPTEPADAADWVRGTAEALRSLARTHPNLVPLLTVRTLPLADPQSAQPFEAGLAAFVRAGYDARGAFAAVQSTALSLLSITQLEAMVTLHADDPEPDPGDSSGIDSLSPEDFPMLHRVLEDAPEPTEIWDSLVETLVRGFGLV